jgi:hypothetical protein
MTSTFTAGLFEHGERSGSHDLMCVAPIDHLDIGRRRARTPPVSPPACAPGAISTQAFVKKGASVGTTGIGDTT